MTSLVASAHAHMPSEINIIITENFHKLERVYIMGLHKRSRQDQDNTVYRMMHQVLDDSDQTRKYDISDP